MADRRLTKIRLPLQIGTSALWSLARASALFPGIVLAALGGLAGSASFRTKSGDVEFSIALVLLITGGYLVYYAVRHAKLVLDERPSDVVLDAQGLRVDGGARDGLALAWTEIDPSKCAISHEKESRVILWRVIANLPLMALSLALDDSILIDYTRKVPVQRLWVAPRGGGERVLVAEADVRWPRDTRVVL